MVYTSIRRSVVLYTIAMVYEYVLVGRYMLYKYSFVLLSTLAMLYRGTCSPCLLYMGLVAWHERLSCRSVRPPTVRGRAER